jgi:tetratricopeptide (TPR) repeat protein
VKINISISIIVMAAGSLLVSCASTNDKGTLASLNDIKFEVKEEKVDDSLEKALASYQKYLDETPETEMTPEALRRLADLKIQKEYVESDLSEEQPVANLVATKDPSTTQKNTLAPIADSASQETDIKTPDTDFVPVVSNDEEGSIATKDSPIADISESEKIFSERAGKKIELGNAKRAKIVSPDDKTGQDAIAMQEAGAQEAIELYEGLLKKYPLFERNDQVLYQLSRAHEETGEVDVAMKSLDQLIEKYPLSRHIGEAYFRRAEYFFTRKRYLEAEESYQYIINAGAASEFYELALYKQGWAYFKQDMYEEALQNFIAMLDYKVDNGYELGSIENKIEKKRLDDTYRVISLSFSYLGGAESIVEYFEKHGHRFYEASIYSHLGEYYLTKRRYSDSANSYQAYIERNPVSKESPYFNIRVIEIYKKGGFPKLVVDSKRDFSKTYSLQSNYWTFFDINEHPIVLTFLKSNLIDLANHYHALYQDRRLHKQKEENYKEAIVWYRQYLASFPEEKLAPALNNQLAGLLLEHKDYLDAAMEYERTSYSYLAHADSASAGYAAVYSYREYLKVVNQSQRNIIKREIIRSSIKFSEYYPVHKHAAVVLVAAVDDMYALEDYEQAITYGRRAVSVYPNADKKLLRSAWMVIAHSSFDLANYKDAEDAYATTLSLTDKNDKSYTSLTENLAASVYKQGEQARVLGDHKLASSHFLRVAEVAPNSKIRPTAEYDAAASLMLLKEWGAVANVLEGFRKLYPKHDLQTDITKKLAVVYQENGEYLKAAAEFERIEKENPKDNTLRREALNQAAELYVKSNEKNKALLVYTKLVDYFPTPIEDAIEARQKMADIYLEQDKRKQYVYQLILTESKLTSFKNVALVKPFKKNLKKKKQKMRTAIEAYTGLVDYQVGEVTAAATYYIAEIYYDFSISLIESERPTNLSADELEEYELVIEDQAYPFEEKAISVHEKNMELLDVGIYNEWIDKSIIKLSVLLPARYAKTEQPDAVLGTIQNSIVLKEDQKKLDSIENKSLTNDSDVGSSNDAVERDGIVDKDSAATEKFISASNVVNDKLESKHLENKSLGATND